MEEKKQNIKCDIVNLNSTDLRDIYLILLLGFAVFKLSPW